MLKKQIGKWLFGFGSIVLFFAVVKHLIEVIPSNVISLKLYKWIIRCVVISVFLICLGYFLQGKIHKKTFEKHIRGYFSQILLTLVTTLIVIILLVDVKYRTFYPIAILIISFILYVISEEIK